MQKYILIGTTAINRPDLHHTTLINWFKLITKAHNYKIVWFVNIDKITKLPFTTNDVIDNLTKIASDKVILNILPEKEPCFLTACQVVSKSIIDYVSIKNIKEENVCVFWLEDDWQLHPFVLEKYNLDIFFEIMNNNSYVNLSFLRNNYIWALAPSMIGFNLFKNLFFNAWNKINIEKLKETSKDPEHLVGLYFKQNISTDNIDLKTINIIDKKINKDYFNQAFTCWKNSKNIVLNKDNNYSVDEGFVPNEINKTEIVNFLNNDINFIRISPGWCCDIGRKYMENINIKKWKKGENDCNYN